MRNIPNKPGWIVYKFEDFVENIREQVMPTKEDSKKYIGLEHLDSGSLHVRRWGTKIQLKGTKFRMKKGDLLFARRNAYLRRVAIAPHDGLFSAHGMIFRSNNDVISPDFLPFFLSSDVFMDRAIKISVGSLSPTINWGTLRHEEFSLPPLNEQRRLADLLWSVDETMEAYRKILGSLKMSLQVFMDDLIKEPNENSIRLGDFVLIEKGLTYSSNDYGDDKKGEILINLKCFKKFGGFNKDGIKFFKGEYKCKYILEKDDLIIANTDVTRNGDVVGYPVLVPDFGNRVILFTMDVSRLKIKNNDRIIASYLFYLLRTRWAHWYMYSHSSGTTVLHLNVNSVNELPVPKVNVAGQRKIVNKLRSIEVNIERYQNLEKFAGNVQKQIINQIFGGKS